MARERVWVCRKCTNAPCLISFLKETDGVKVKRVGCQKICKGPVAGIEVDGRMEWFARLDRAKPMVALARAASSGRKKRLVRPLRSRRVDRRSGQTPR